MKEANVFNTINLYGPIFWQGMFFRMEVALQAKLFDVSQQAWCCCVNCMTIESTMSLIEMIVASYQLIK